MLSAASWSGLCGGGGWKPVPDICKACALAPQHELCGHRELLIEVGDGDVFAFDQLAQQIVCVHVDLLAAGHRTRRVDGALVVLEERASGAKVAHIAGGFFALEACEAFVGGVVACDHDAGWVWLAELDAKLFGDDFCLGLGDEHVDVAAVAATAGARGVGLCGLAHQLGLAA